MQGFNPFSSPVQGPDPTCLSIPQFFFLDQHGEGGNFSTTVDLARWHQTGNAGTGNGVIQDNVRGGAQALVTGTTTGHTVHWQLNGGSFIPADGYEQIFRWEGSLTVLAQGTFSCGFTDPTITDVHDDTVKNGAMFWTPSADGILYCVVGDGTTQTSTSSGVTLAAATDADLGIHIKDGEEVFFYIDGDLVHRTKLNVPSVDLTAFQEVRNPVGTTSGQIIVNTTGAAEYYRPH